MYVYISRYFPPTHVDDSFFVSLMYVYMCVYINSKTMILFTSLVCVCVYVYIQ